jgi:hypothetical protein
MKFRKLLAVLFAFGTLLLVQSAYASYEYDGDDPDGYDSSEEDSMDGIDSDCWAPEFGMTVDGNDPSTFDWDGYLDWCDQNGIEPYDPFEDFDSYADFWNWVGSFDDDNWWDDWDGEFLLLDASGTNSTTGTASQLYVANGVGLRIGDDTSAPIGCCVVNAEGILEPLVNEDKWSILANARSQGNDTVADILHESVVRHEQTHIDDAIMRNPILDGSDDGHPLPEGAALGSHPSLTSEREWSAHQAQIDFLDECIMDFSYNGINLSIDEVSILQDAKEQVLDMQLKQSRPKP